MELTKEQLEAVVAEAQASIRERVARDATDSLKHVITSAVESTLHEEIRTFITAEIVPEIRARLTAVKPMLVEAAVTGAHGAVKVIADAMVERVTKTMATSWEADRALAALFGGRS